MKYFVWCSVIMLVILHQDYWFWNDSQLVWGFLPIGFFYQICISVAASAAWLLATRFCWPTDLEQQKVDHQKESGSR